MPKLKHEHLLSLCEFRYRQFTGLEASINVCPQCLPDLQSHGFKIVSQCGEDDLLWAHAFVDNQLVKVAGVSEWVPTLTRGICKVCDAATDIHKLRIDIKYILPCPDDLPKDYPALNASNKHNAALTVFGKPCRIIMQRGGFPKPFAWLNRYRVRFEDGTEQMVTPWQIKVEENSHA